MRTAIRVCLTLFLAFSLLLAVRSQPASPWAQGDPTPEEQQAMEWLNAARRDPPGTLAGILSLAASDSVIAGFMQAQAPITAAQFEQWLQISWQEALADSAAYSASEAISQAPLAFYPLFQQQAAALGAAANPPPLSFPAQRQPPAYLYPVPIFGEALLGGPANVLAGPNATGGAAQFGPWGGNYTEVSQANLYAPSVTPREWILSSLLASYPDGDWSPPPVFLTQGDPLPNLTLGHTRMVGIGISAGGQGNRILTFVGGSSEFFTASDLPFGNANTVFITGVAFQDNQGDGIYAPGEGLGGVTVAPDHGNWYAVTSSSGGYAIPVPANSGPYILTASGGGLGTRTATVTIEADSAKIDWIWPAPPRVLPAQVPVPASDGATQLAGFSTRGLVEAGADALIGGFVINGPASARKTVLVRGVGPSLQTVGFPAEECIPATQIQLMSGATPVASNQGWTTAPDGGAAAAQGAIQAGDFPLVDWAGGGGDSACVVTLPPGAYTVLLSPAAGTPPSLQIGRIGLVEIYDLSPNDGSRLTNLSTRALAGPGDEQTIIGCSVSGAGHERLLFRGAGPALGSSLNLPGALADPALTLFGALGGPLLSNAGWSESAQTDQIAALAAAVGAFSWPAGSADAALVALLPPGNATAAVGPAGGTGMGLVLVEIYEAN